MVITEEEEEPEEEEIEEVEAFTPVDLRRGERVDSIVFIDDPGTEPESGDEKHEPDLPRPDSSVANTLHEYEEQHVLEKSKERTDDDVKNRKMIEDTMPSPRHNSVNGVNGELYSSVNSTAAQ